MTTQTQTNAHSKKPTHRLYVVTGPDENPVWRNIGAAWPNRDHEGFTLLCDAVPTNGRIVMREIKPRNDENQGRLV